MDNIRLKSREYVLDSMKYLYELQNKCNSVTPAIMRDTVHHLEDAYHSSEITKNEYDLLYRDLVAIGAEFTHMCSCVKLKNKRY